MIKQGGRPTRGLLAWLFGLNMMGDDIPGTKGWGGGGAKG